MDRGLDVYMVRDLRAARKKLRLSQAELAEALGMSLRTLVAMENYDTKTDRRTYMAVSYLLLLGNLEDLGRFMKIG